eukprot:6498291-Alexandrium_andersonii.AAC.1
MLRAPSAPPISAVVDTEGCMHTDIDKIDELMQQAWQQVYEVPGSQTDLACRFVEKYADWIVDLPLHDMGRLSVGQVLRAFRANGRTSAGPDAWAPGELRHMPKAACYYITRMFQRVEQGASWPSEVLVAKISWLQKSEQATCDPYKFRGLLIASIIYRTWGK